MSHSILNRLTAVPLSRRLYQVANGVLNQIAGGPMKILHVVEYPRCGGSWVRHLLQDALEIPQYAYDRILTPRTIIQCHKLPNPGIRRAIILFRDPRDALTSFYHKKTKFDQRLSGEKPFQNAGYRHDPSRPLQDDFHAWLEAHLRDPDHPRFRFSEFANAWLDWDNESSIVTKYESFKADPSSELQRLIEFTGQPATPEAIAASVKNNSFANRTQQRSGNSRSEGTADNAQFERKGIVGDWKNTFNREARELFRNVEGDILIRLGYERDHAWVEDE